MRSRINGQGQPIRVTYPERAHISNLAAAREWAVRTDAQMRAGIDPRIERQLRRENIATEIERRERTKFSAVADSFLKKHASRNRSYYEIKRIVDFYLRPGWGDRQIRDIRRSDIAARLDLIEAAEFVGTDGKRYGGPVMADRALAQLRKLFNWYAARDPDFVSPIVVGMARTRPAERARTRVLSDDEIRLLWPLLRRMGVFGAAVKMLLLTAQRRSEVQQMRRSQIGPDFVWEIPAAKYKSKRPHHVPLTATAVAHLNEQIQFEGSDLVFTLDGKHEFQNWGHATAKLRARMTRRRRALARYCGEDPASLAPMDRFTIHDIRRTCRSLMSRAGVRPDIAERVIGHAIPGVAGIYDRHTYAEEKRQALEALAMLLERIVTGDAAHVVQLRAAE